MVSLQSEFYDGFMCFCCESLVTLVTVICFLLSVSSLMNLKITFLWKSCITLAALIWFFPSVISLVIYTMLFPCKSFITLAPWIQHFSSVSSLMVCHIGGIDIIFPRCEFFDEVWDYLFVKKHHYKSFIDRISLQCEFYYEHEDCFFKDDNTR